MNDQNPIYIIWNYNNPTKSVEIIKSFENGTIKEAFGAGTAATIASINCIHYNDQDYFLPEPSEDFFSTKVLSFLNDYKKGLIEDKFNWLIRF